MRDDEGPGPLTHASDPGAAIHHRISVEDHLASMARFEAVALVALAAACGRLHVPPETGQEWRSNRGARGLA